MIAVDTNILVYSHRSDSGFHARADSVLVRLAESASAWAIPWPCIHEFLAIVTHPGIYAPPTPLADALLQVECWPESPSLHLLCEADSGSYWQQLRESLQDGRVAGPLVHDCRVAALCRAHRVEALWTTDRDFSRFPSLAVVNPLS